MKRLGVAARHMTDEGRKAISLAQKERWARAKNDVRTKKQQKETDNTQLTQLQNEIELLKQEVAFYRNLYLNGKKAA